MIILYVVIQKLKGVNLIKH